MDIYREEILDHAKNPRNWGKIENPTHQIKFPNPLCGDMVELTLKVNEKTKKVAEARFETNGCVVSVAASSLLTENIIGKNLKDLKSMGDEEILRWFGGDLTSSRRDCALLPLHALKQALS
ncbi:MAG: iron-sulfur cluster assembly scaffold protein [Patescibacteria group bacterium]